MISNILPFVSSLVLLAVIDVSIGITLVENRNLFSEAVDDSGTTQQTTQPRLLDPKLV